MQLKGKLIQLTPLQTGIGKNGEWKKQDVIIQTEGQYPKKVCVSIWGDKINNNVLQVDKNLVIDFEIESRSFNDRWYTNIKAWRITSAELEYEKTPKLSNTDNAFKSFLDSEEGDDELPF